MPILPPLKSTIASITAAADRALDPLLDVVAAVPPPRPQPEPRDYIGIIHSDGIIQTVTEPNTATALSNIRNQIINDSDGAMSMTVVAAWMKPLLENPPQQSTSRILDILEAVQQRAYKLMMPPPKQGR
jgi:hypothetical protein